jgi:hypothetical protein
MGYAITYGDNIMYDSGYRDFYSSMQEWDFSWSCPKVATPHWVTTKTGEGQPVKAGSGKNARGKRNKKPLKRRNK